MTDLDELSRLLQQATPGPWRQTDWGNQIVSGTGQNEILVATIATNTYRDQARHVGDLIPALRNHAEELVLDARRYRWLIKCAWFQNESEFRLGMKPEHIYPEDVGPYIDAAIAQMRKV